MAGINFDATQVAPDAGSPSPVEPGKYTVAITKSEFKPTKDGSGKLLAMTCTIQGGANHGRSIITNLNWENASADAVRIGRGRLSAIAHAVNVLHVQDTQQLHGIPFLIEVDVTVDGKYNEVKGIYPLTQQMPQAQPQMQPQPQFAPVQQFAPAGQANPMQQYEQMAQPQPGAQGFAQGQPNQQPQQFVQQMQPQQAQNEVPDWIKNQMAQQQAPMGNG